jgi:hypothetical protein
MIFGEYTQDYFAQLPHQSENELKYVFRFENMNFNFLSGIGTVIPFSVGGVWNSTMTLQGRRGQEKSDHFYDTPFDNIRYYGVAQTNNTLTISQSRPNLKLNIDGYYVSPSLQGLYRLGSVYDLSAGLKWTFLNDKAALTLRCNNIFRSNVPRTYIDSGSQYSRLKIADDNRYFGIAFSWKFGGYQKAKHEEIDKSRFGK